MQDLYEIALLFLIKQVPLVIGVTLLWSLSFYYLTVSLLGYPIRRKQILIYAFVSVIPQLISNILYLYILYKEIPYVGWVRNIWDIAFIYTHIVMLVAFLQITYREKFIKTLSTAALCEFICFSIYHFFEWLVLFLLYGNDVPEIYVGYKLLVVHFTPYLILLALVFLIPFLLEKIRFQYYYAFLFTTKVKSVLTLLTSLLLLNFYLIPRIITNSNYNVFETQGVSLILIVIIILLFQIIAVFIANSARIKSQEATIAQQNSYMSVLEDFQAEIKTFRHDFQNILTGMSLQASEGNIEELKKYLSSTVGYFDTKIGHELNTMTRLAQLNPYSLRSLLTIKFNTMKESNIAVSLDVIGSIAVKDIQEEDLIRCIGILIDNAIEECTGKESAEIKIIFHQDKKYLGISISNTCPEKPPMQKMMQAGYSTKKDKHSGLGLASYQRILSNYENCASHTVWQNGILTQELRIQSK